MRHDKKNSHNISNKYRLFFALAGIFFLSLASSVCFGLEGVELDFEVIKISESSSGDPNQISGNLTIRNWNSSRGFCLYLPYNDPNYGKKRLFAQRFSINRNESSYYRGGEMNIESLGPNSFKAKKLTDFLLYIETEPLQRLINELHIGFKGVTPRLEGSHKNTWFFDQFYPVPLKECPQNITMTDYYTHFPDNYIKAEISIPKGWNFAGPESKLNDPQGISIEYRANHLAFIVTKEHKHKIVEISGRKVRLYYFSENFLELIPSIGLALQSHQKWFGPYPFPSLTIIETSEVERVDVQGMVYLNTPRQDIFKTLQSSWMNWRQWMIVSLLASQWAGASLQIDNPDDWWFLAGFIEFATLEALKSDSSKNTLFDLLNPDKGGDRDYTLNYEQFQQALAALLYDQNKTKPLTNSFYGSFAKYDDQHKLNYIRHAILLKQLKQIAGETPFVNFMHLFFQEFKFASVRPADFVHLFSRLPSPFLPQKREQLSAAIRQWWQKSEWPDVALNKFSSDKTNDQKWRTTIELEQISDLRVPYELRLTDANGEKNSIIMGDYGRNQKITKYETESDAEIVLAELDPNYQFYDKNRFNNKNTLPGIKFFPGNLSTLSDSDYSLIWLPFVFRRPGEPFSLSVEGALFRFIDNIIKAKVDYAPDQSLLGYDLQHTRKNEELLLNTSFQITRSYDQLQTYRILLQRQPLSATWSHTSISAAAARIEILGRKNYGHQLFELGSSSQVSLRNNFCKVMFAPKLSAAPKTAAISYEKFEVNSNALCQLYPGYDFSLSNYLGKINTTNDELPAELQINAERLDGPKIRLDAGEDQISKHLVSYNFDLLLPLRLGLPENTFVLTRRLRSKLFYDIGHSFRPEEKKFRAYGLGIVLPFGGQLSGMSALSISRLSLVSVLYREYGDIKSHKPSFLFDFSGNL